jgi:uncharacterized membrane protein YbjE (DUF340 family)
MMWLFGSRPFLASDRNLVRLLFDWSYMLINNGWSHVLVNHRRSRVALLLSLLLGDLVGVFIDDGRSVGCRVPC